MAITTISGSGINNNGGVLLNNGANSYTSSLWTTLTQRNSAFNQTKVAPIVNQGGAIKPYSAGTFLYYPATVQEIVLMPGVSQKLSGATSDALKNYASNIQQQPIASYRGTTRSHITAWNYLTHAPTYGGSRGTVVKLNDMAGNADVVEAYPTRAVPGEFVYTYGSPNPVQANYASTL